MERANPDDDYLELLRRIADAGAEHPDEVADLTPEQTAEGCALADAAYEEAYAVGEEDLWFELDDLRHSHRYQDAAFIAYHDPGYMRALYRRLAQLESGEGNQ